MPSGLTKFSRLVRMEWSRTAQYRIDLFLWSLSEAAIPLISLAVWYQVAAQGHSILNKQEVLTYYILIIFINIVTSAWNDYFLSQQILSGEIVQYLARPFPALWNHAANNVAEKATRMLLFIPILLITFIVAPNVFAPAIYGWWHIAAFLLSLLLGTIIAFTLGFNIGALAFWLEDVNQLRSYKSLLQEITSGVMIPFVFLPGSIQTIFSYLPFRYIISVPAELLLGQAEKWEAFQLIGIQCLWVIGLLVLLNFLWKRGLKKYAPPGQ